MRPKEPARTPVESPSLQERTNRACDAFEARLKAGARPRLEDYLASAPEEEKRVLLRELLRVEIEYRRGQGKAPRAEEYTARFPAEADVIQGVFSDVQPVAPGIASRPGAMRLSLPGYEVLKELGRGGMGVVYLARNKLMDRPEVLKVVNPQLLHEPGTAERFLLEIRAAARLCHPNIVTAYTALELGDFLVLAMEYVEGEDLAQVVKARGPLPLPNACTYACQAALGLQHAFEKGMVHRDIKPHNLILGRDGKKHVVKILDFGLAKATREGEQPAPGLTGTDMMMGTPDYMAPEQARDARTADIRADLYSLGCTLYFLLSGRPPFQAPSLYDVLHAHQALRAAPLSEVRREVPVELAAVVAKLMAKDPGGRYQKPVEVAQALTPFAKAGLKPLPATAAEVVPLGVPAGDTMAAAPGPALQATRIERQATIARGLRRGPARPARPAAGKRSRGCLAVAVGVAVLLLAGLIALLSGVFQAKRSPSTAVRAKELQQVWAKHLSRKVEEEVGLGGGVMMQFVLIPPGSFTMGSPRDEEGRLDHEDAHPVTITQPFYLGKYTVTQEQYQQLMGKNPSWFSAGGGGRLKVAGQDTGRFPVEKVSWDDAAAFCVKLAEKAGRKARLPSEAEWEYACRAGTVTPFHFGAVLNGTEANCNGDHPYGTKEKGPFLGRTCRVGSYRPNAFGLHDMHGNVYQWCQDWYATFCADLGGSDPVRVDKSSDSFRVLRGGSWYSIAGLCRAAYRSGFAPASHTEGFGFRVAFRLD